MEYLFHFAQRFGARGRSFIRRAFADHVLNRPAARRRVKLSDADTSRAGRTVLNSIPVTSESPAASPANNENTPPSTAGMTTKVVKGSLWTLAGQVAPLGVSLFATPFVIRLLGAEGYGVLILVSLIPTYLGFADLGMGLASTKFASEAYAAGDAEREARTVRTAAVIALCTSVPVAVAVFLFSGRLVTLFNVPEHLAWEASAALKVASVTFVLNFLNQIFNTPQLTRLRMDLNTFVNSGFRILGIAATPIVIYLGGGILGAVIVLLAAALLTLGGHVYMSGRLLPPLFDISLDRNAIRPLLKFGGPIVASGVAAVLLANLEKGILPWLTSVKELAFYSVAFNFSSMLTMFSSSMSQSLLPAFAQLFELRSTDALNSLWNRAIRINLLLLPMLLVVLYFISPYFFEVWAGHEFRVNSSRPFHFLLIGLAFHLLTYLPYTALLAKGLTHVLAKLYLIELPFYCIAAFFLIRRFGAIGAAIAWSVRIITDNLLLFFLVSRGSELKCDWRKQGKTISAGLIFLPILGLDLAFTISVPVLFGLVIFSLAAYVAIVAWFVAEAEETAWLLGRFRRLSI